MHLVIPVDTTSFVGEILSRLVNGIDRMIRLTYSQKEKLMKKKKRYRS